MYSLVVTLLYKLCQPLLALLSFFNDSEDLKTFYMHDRDVGTYNKDNQFFF